MKQKMTTTNFNGISTNKQLLNTTTLRDVSPTEMQEFLLSGFSNIFQLQMNLTKPKTINTLFEKNY